jgi:hypothetical protein
MFPCWTLSDRQPPSVTVGAYVDLRTLSERVYVAWTIPPKKMNPPFVTRVTPGGYQEVSISFRYFSMAAGDGPDANPGRKHETPA